MKIQNELNVDEFPHIMKRRLSVTQIIIYAAAVVLSVVIMALLYFLAGISPSFGCYFTFPVTFAVAFFCGGSFHGVPAAEWIKKQQELKAGKRIYLFSSAEESDVEDADRKERAAE